MRLENLFLRAITEANLYSEMKMKVVWNTCDKEPSGEMKSVNENYLPQKFIWDLRKATPF